MSIEIMGLNPSFAVTAQVTITNIIAMMLKNRFLATVCGVSIKKRSFIGHKILEFICYFTFMKMLCHHLLSIVSN